jgi:hypothetical protein
MLPTLLSHWFVTHTMTPTVVAETDKFTSIIFKHITFTFKNLACKICFKPQRLYVTFHDF